MSVRSVSPLSANERRAFMSPNSSPQDDENAWKTPQSHVRHHDDNHIIENEPKHEKAAQTAVGMTGPGLETFLADIFSLGVPLALLVFLSILISRNGKEASLDAIGEWKNAASILSTLFPLVFAAIVGRLMIQAARWRLEGGASIGTLEQLLGSRTVGGAILTQFHLGAFNILALCILLLWALSPVGAQAILRIVEPRHTTVSRAAEMPYFDTFRSAPSDTVSTYKSGWGSQETEGELDVRNTIYGSMLLAPPSVKKSAVDLWDNVKIPRLSSNGDDWQDYSPRSDSDYSSLLGIPVLNISDGNTTFNIESTYLDLSCGDVQLWKSVMGFSSDVMSAPQNATDRGYLNSTYMNANSGRHGNAPPNGTFQGVSVNRTYNTTRSTTWSIGVDRILDRNWFLSSNWTSDKAFTEEFRYTLGTLGQFEDEKGIDAGPTRLMFQGYVSYAANVATTRTEYVATFCDVHQKYVESRIRCTKDETSQQACAVIAQRPSQKYKYMPENLNELNFPDTLSIASEYMPLASGDNVGIVGSRDLTLQYLADSSMGKLAGGELSLQNVTSADISTRLLQAINTYIQLTSMNYAALNLNTGGATQLSKSQTTTNGQVETGIIVYSISPLWAGFAVACCVILLAGATAGVVFAHISFGPEVLGYVTTALRRHNVDIPKHAETMGGLEIARELKSRRVRYGVSGLEDDSSSDGDRMNQTQLRV